TFGKASILSFAGGKILPTKGGGAVLIDDPELYKLVSGEISKLSERPNDLALTASVLRDKLTNAFNMARMDDPGKASEWYGEFKSAGDIYNYSISDEEALKISDEIKKLGNIRDTRTDGVGIYREQLDIDRVECLEYPAECCPYRFSFILPELSGTEVQEVTNEIRAEGMHASNLYLPLHWLAPGHVTVGECPRAEHAGIRIINLWLTDGIPERDASRVRDIVVKWVNR
ncbi:DegT/DnrJ/EryC1/StrS family aminotransferase, partial [bacterium]|nr:DegT/DnrJ/EryC1/StrS family aminotransferase [bacterium]